MLSKLISRGRRVCNLRQHQSLCQQPSLGGMPRFFSSFSRRSFATGPNKKLDEVKPASKKLSEEDEEEEKFGTIPCYYHYAKTTLRRGRFRSPS